MDIERLLRNAKGLPDEDVLGMILSNRIDFGSAEGGLISAKQIPLLIDDIKAWVKARDEAAPAG